MKTFVCKRLRLCNYLMDRGFFPYRVEPDKDNPSYSVYLFEETTALTAAVVRYFSKDCYTARTKKERIDRNVYSTNEEK